MDEEEGEESDTVREERGTEGEFNEEGGQFKGERVDGEVPISSGTVEKGEMEEEDELRVGNE